MNTIDIILLALIVVPALWTGISKGLIHQVVGIIAVFAGAILAYKFADVVGQWLSAHLTASPNVIYIISFTIILIAVMLGLFLIGKLIASLFKAVLGGMPDKLLGIVFAVAKTVLLAGIAVWLFDGLNDKLELVKQDTLDGSKVYGWLVNLTDTLFPYIKNLIGKGAAA